MTQVQCVAVCCSVLKCVAMHYSVLQYFQCVPEERLDDTSAVRCNVLQCVPVCSSVSSVSVCSSVFQSRDLITPVQCVAVCCSVSQCIPVCCSVRVEMCCRVRVGNGRVEARTERTKTDVRCPKTDTSLSFWSNALPPV